MGISLILTDFFVKLAVAVSAGAILKYLPGKINSIRERLLIKGPKKSPSQPE